MSITRRPWFRFSLRTVFVVVTVVAIFGTLAWAIHWKRQRQEAIARLDYVGYPREPRPEEIGVLRPLPKNGWAYYGRSSPFPLWLIGEKGIYLFASTAPLPEDEFHRICALFPEAWVSWRTDTDPPGFLQRTTEPP
jgi:hypothetical protein